MALQLPRPLCRNPFNAPIHLSTKPIRFVKFSIRNVAFDQSHQRKYSVYDAAKKLQLVMEVKEKLEKDRFNLPVGRNGRDDEDTILWYLKDRKYSVKDTISKLTKAIRWRREFGVSDLSEQSVESAAETGKAYVHDSLDVYGRPVLIANISKHIPGDPYEDERLCVFLIEKALSKLPDGKEEILLILDVRGFETRNADVKLLPFLFDVFYNYYPRRLGEVLVVDAPFIYVPVWHLTKPFLKSYGSLVRLCSARDVGKDYFTKTTIPASFRH